MVRNYLITGATSGIGAALVESLLSQGHRILGLGRSEDNIKHLLTEFNTQLRFYNIDLSKKIEDLAIIDNFVREHGKFNGMVYCAGQEETVPISFYTHDRLNNLMNVNFVSAFELTKLLSKKKATENFASFIFISSVMGDLGQPGKTGYCASKSALLGLMRASALELAIRGIRVNAISPGVVETPMTEKLFAQIGDDGRKKILDMHPLGFGKTKDILPAIEFLLSDNSKWITGQNIKIDGGYSVH